MATPVAPELRGKGFLKRELNGATFLTLEHIAHMALVVVVSTLLLSSVACALSMWLGTTGVAPMLMGGLSAGSGRISEAAIALGLVAALLVLVPLLVILDRRTRAEWHKRVGYAGRLAYKVPVYTALAVLGTALVSLKIQMVYVVISSLAFIGVEGAPIGDLYIESFVPALISYAVFGAAAWYVFNLAKGRDNGRMFSMAYAVLGGVMAVALLITSLVVVHDKKSSPNIQLDPNSSRSTEPAYDEEYYRDLLDKYYQ